MTTRGECSSPQSNPGYVGLSSLVTYYIGNKRSFQMSPLRKTALVAGALYLLTFVSIPTLFRRRCVHWQAILSVIG